MVNLHLWYANYHLSSLLAGQTKLTVEMASYCCCGCAEDDDYEEEEVDGKKVKGRGQLILASGVFFSSCRQSECSYSQESSLA